MKYSIPKISNEKIQEMLNKMAPVVKGEREEESQELFWIEIPHAREVSFIWSPVLKGKAVGLKKVSSIQTFHSYGYYSFFKPSLAEVLSQIPEQYLDGSVVAFETIGPRDISDIKKQWDVVQAGFHVAETILYGKA